MYTADCEIQNNHIDCQDIGMCSIEMTKKKYTSHSQNKDFDNKNGLNGFKGGFLRECDFQ